MVQHSERAFRMLTRRHGADLCYTQMIHSKNFSRSEKFRKQNFDAWDEVAADRPLIAQFCGHDPEVILEAAKHVEPFVDAVDLNFGCPQKIAQKGLYGAFLLEDRPRVLKIIETLSSKLSVPVTCKIRLLPAQDATREAWSTDIDQTLSLATDLVAAGCEMLVVHGRTRHQNKQFSGAADWNAIKRVKAALDIPVIANGGIETLQDSFRCLKVTGADGVMSSEALLENPALFSEQTPSTLIHQTQLALELIELSVKYPSAMRSSSCTAAIKSHMFKILHSVFKQLQPADERRMRGALGKADTHEDIRRMAREMLRLSAEGEAHTPPPTWYRRHRVA
jgi:tRNA-dihydrouridine synthase 1